MIKSSKHLKVLNQQDAESTVLTSHFNSLIPPYFISYSYSVSVHQYVALMCTLMCISALIYGSCSVEFDSASDRHMKSFRDSFLGPDTKTSEQVVEPNHHFCSIPFVQVKVVWVWHDEHFSISWFVTYSRQVKTENITCW